MKVSLSQYPPNVGVGFRQCTASPADVAADCTRLNQQVIAVTDSTGAGGTYLPVYAGSDTALQNSGNTGAIVCDSSHACSIAAVRNNSDLKGAVLASIAFAPAPDSCPPPGSSAVLGGGSASAYRAIYAWETAVCRPPANLAVGFTVTNSPDGAASFLSGQTDFGVTGPTVPPQIPSGAPKFEYAPLTASAVVLAYRMYDRRGPQITNLTLTPEMVARIFLGQRQNWNASDSADIQQLNPGLELPVIVNAFARAEHSSQTMVFTSWMAATAGKVWTNGPQQIFPLPPSGVSGVTGNVGLAVVNPAPDPPYPQSGNIGFMDSSTAAFYGLPTVRIQRADGSTVSATSDSITKALGHVTQNSDGTLTPDYATTDPLAYPMPVPTLMMAPTSTVTPQRGAVVGGFLRYSVQDGQAKLPPGYAALPSSLVKRSLQVADHIPGAVPPKAPIAATAPPTASSPATAGPGDAGPAAQGVASSAAPPPLPPGAGSLAAPVGPVVTPAVSAAHAPGAACVARVNCQTSPRTPLSGGLAPSASLVEDVARLVLPSIVLLAAVGLAGGPAIQLVARRTGAPGRRTGLLPRLAGWLAPLQQVLFGQRQRTAGVRD